MDKLPWFKFSPSDWMMGKIQRCPEDTQARFLRLCCLYWNKCCHLSIEDAIIEIDKFHFDILKNKKIISVNETHFNISFLDEQFIENNEITKNRKISGIIGNLKRWHPDIYNKFQDKKISLNEAIKLSQSIADLSHTDSKPIASQSQSIADKNRIEDKREDNNTKSIDFDFDLFLQFLNSTLKKNHRIISDKVKTSYKARLKDGYTKEDIKNAILNVKKVKLHIDNGFQYCTPEFFSRESTLEKYSTTTKQNKRIEL